MLNKYTYDQGGNLTKLKRHDASGTIIDSMAYNYAVNAQNKLLNNKLNSVNDLGNATGMPTGNSAYLYDADGRLSRDLKENLNMRWTMDNKIRQVAKGSATTRYLYDASGNRVMKRLTNDTAEYIFRDATGNELERITRKNTTWVRSEGSVYGSTRIGTLNFPSTTTADTIENRASGRYNYELVDHLGNVRATVTDVKTFATITSGYTLSANVTSATDYYPFGMPSRTFQPSYKWGFNGKENDQEILSGGRMQDYGFRGYRPDLGRFFAVDPLAKEYPYYTPYQFGGNDVIRFIDRDGLEPAGLNVFWESVGKTKLATKQLVNKVEQKAQEVMSLIAEPFSDGKGGKQKVGENTTSESGKGPSETKQKATESTGEDFRIDDLLAAISAIMPWSKADLKPPSFKDPEKVPEVVDKFKSVTEKTKEVIEGIDKENMVKADDPKPLRTGSQESYGHDGDVLGDSVDYLYPNGYNEIVFESKL